MRYTRFEFKNINSINRKRTLTKFLLILPFIIALGFMLSKLFILPNILERNPQDKKVKYVYQYMESRSFYLVQMGAFASSDNAKAYAETLRNNNIPAYVDNSGKYSFVLNYAGADRKTAEDKLKYYKSNGYICLIKQIDIIPYNLQGENALDDRYILLSRLVNEAGSFIDCCSSSFDSFEQEKIDYSVLTKNIKKLYMNVNECLNEYVNLKNVQLPEEEYEGWRELDRIMNDIIDIDNDSDLYVKFNEKLIKAIYGYLRLAEMIKP